MKFIADLHIHSKYSRATAKNLDFENLYYHAQIKGLQVVGTGDFTHPAWSDEIRTKLEEKAPGLYTLKQEIANKIDPTIPETCRNPVYFILQSEISCIYKKDGRVRKNHNLIYFPDLKSVEIFNAKLAAIGNIKSDGRPILGLDAKDLLSIMLEVNDQGIFVPAHIWTPWFSLFGSKSGFDAMEECFGSLTHHIFAVETGLSSDPPMNWRIKDLDNVRLIASSDAHSPGYLGRNASVFNTDIGFTSIRDALETNDLEKYHGTLDMHPHQGKYHYDGHRKCQVCLNPVESARMENLCPVCQKPLTLGVLHRVQELANRPEGYIPENRPGFKHIIPLADMMSEIFQVGPKTKKVAKYYNKAITLLGPELQILLDSPINEIENIHIPLLAQAITKMRSGDIHIDPGFDGEFGKVKLFTTQEKESLKGEKRLLFKEPSAKKKKTASGRTIKNQDSTRKKTAKNTIDNRIKKEAERSAHRTEEPKDILSGLNPEQQKAVDSDNKAVIIKAGPGTGKTRTLTAKIAHLVHKKGVNPDAILALTFTNKAARELEQRIEKYLPESKRSTSAPGILAATFHAFSLKLLQRYQGFNATIVDEEVRLKVLEKVIGKAGLDNGIDTGKCSKRQIKNIDLLISMAKQQLLAPEDDLAFLVADHSLDIGISPLHLQQVSREYEKICQMMNIADFEGLIFQTVQLLQNNPIILSQVRHQYTYLFVDEYQDLNLGQYELVKLMARDHHIFVIGDPDQSIYGFRGSDNKYFHRFETDFRGCEHITLTQNYRSTQKILDASFQVIEKSVTAGDTVKVYSDIDSQKKLMIQEHLSEKAEASAIARMIVKLVGGTSFFSMDSGLIDGDDQEVYGFSDIAVLCRTKQQLQHFITAFEKEGIPFQTADKKRLFELDGIRQLMDAARHVCHADLSAGHESTDEYDDLLLKFKQQVKLDDQKISQLSAALNGCNGAQSLRIISEKTGLDAIIEENETTKNGFEQLVSMAAHYGDLKGFLDAQSLNQDADIVAYDTQKVSLMTMHAAKGLEFCIVFVAGCEQGLIPFSRHNEDANDIEPNDIEEERRLFYVAMTRAKERLWLSYAGKRQIFGKMEKRQRSIFIDDIETGLLKIVESRVYHRPVLKPRQLELF